MKRKTPILIVITILVVSLSFSMVAYGGDGNHDTPIWPLTPNSNSGTNPSGVSNSSDDFVTPPVDVETTTTTKPTTTKKPTTTAKVSISKCTISGIKAKTYTGKALTQSITVKYGKTTLKNKTDYTVSYKSNKSIGTATVTITGKGKYTGSVKKTFKINPKNTTLSKVTAGKKQFKATWKKNTTQTTGYQLQYSTDKNFKKNNKTVTVSKNKTTSKTVKSLKAKKKYYVRIRTYKTVNKTKYYSSWSGAKTVTTKK